MNPDFALGRLGPRARHPSAGRQGDERPGRGVLIVAATPDTCHRVARSVRGLGLVVIARSNAKAALGLANPASFAVVIVDLSDPATQGVSFLQHCAAEDWPPPILAIAGVPGDALSARRLGAEACIGPHWSDGELRRAVRKLASAPFGEPAEEGPGPAGGDAGYPQDQAMPARASPRRGSFVRRHLVPHVLVLDDDYATQTFVYHALGSDAHTVPETTAAHALEALVGEAFDVLVLDLILTGTNGLDVLRQLPSLRRPPRIVVLTGWRAGTTRARELGATAYLHKPCTVAALRRAVLACERDDS
jgi:CheY-like chemotaxis protein